MATGDEPRGAGAGVGGTREPATAGGGVTTSGSAAGRGQGDETKPGFMSSEFWVFLALVVGLIVASIAGSFGSDRTWLLLTLLTVGYLVSRGLAKALKGGGEIKPFFMTTEFWVFAVALIGLFVTGLATSGQHFGELACAYLAPSTQCDTLDGDRVWYYATLLGIGYLVSRGLAKSGAGARP
jgi:hypothetical protein